MAWEAAPAIDPITGRPSTTITVQVVIDPPPAIGFVYDDGGRADAGFTGDAGDCVVRAIAIATGRPYRTVYDDLFDRARADNLRRRSRRNPNPSPRAGVHRRVYDPYLAEAGWLWIPTMAIGQGCTTHLRASELPAGPVIASLSRHVCAVLDGVVHDTHDPSRDGTRCVYGIHIPRPAALR